MQERWRALPDFLRSNWRNIAPHTQCLRERLARLEQVRQESPSLMYHNIINPNVAGDAGLFVLTEAEVLESPSPPRSPPSTTSCAPFLARLFQVMRENPLINGTGMRERCPALVFSSTGRGGPKECTTPPRARGSTHSSSSAPGGGASGTPATNATVGFCKGVGDFSLRCTEKEL